MSLKGPQIAGSLGTNPTPAALGVYRTVLPARVLLMSVSCLVLEGLLTSLTPGHLVVMFMAVASGILVGALPGLTATMAVALIMPFTFAMDPAMGLIAMGSLYVAAMFADAVPAILINTPGTAAAMATSIDGFPMTKAGKGQHALIAAAFSSLVGALLGGLALLFVAQPLASFSLRFGPPEYFWIGVFALTVIGSVSAGSFWKGLAGGVLGLLLSTVGIATAGVAVRYTYGIRELQAGLNLVAALIGLFAIPQVLGMIEAHRTAKYVATYDPRPGVFRETMRVVLRKPFHLLRSSAIGIAIGIIPGPGAPVASLVSYNEAVRWSRGNRQFGNGAIEGVTASESANNAAAPSGMVPLLALGIPNGGPEAVMFGALLLHGIQPGPQLFSIHGAMVYTFIWALLWAGIVTFVVGSLLSRPLASIISVPVYILVPIILTLCVMGSFAVRNNMTDVYIMLVIGIGAYYVGKLGIRPGPVALGLILGPIVESGFVTSLALARASSIINVFFLRPMSPLLISLSVVAIGWVAVSAWKQWRTGLENQDRVNKTPS